MLGPIALFFTLVYAWRADRPTIITPADAAIVTAVDADLYGLLARGFLKGQLSLDAAPPAELVAATNPYDPGERPPVLFLHDASIYRGKYYIYFGPAPALLVFAPWRLITQHDFPSPWAVFVFVTAAYLALVALVRSTMRDWLNASSWMAETAVYWTLGGASFLLPLARRPAAYEVAISFGCASALWALYCAHRSRTARLPVGWAAGCGLLIGIAIAARPTFGLSAIPACWLMLWGRPIRTLYHDRRLWIAALVGLGCLAGLLAYNQARFGSPFEFGQRYQLSSANEGAIRHFGLQFLPTQLWYYFFAPVHFDGFFPFIRDTSAISPPAGFGSHEFSFGLITNFPVTWLALIAIASAFRDHRLRPIVGAMAIGAAISAAPLLLYFGSCVRYQAEFAPLIALLAACGILILDAMASRRRRAVGAIALTAAVSAGGLSFFSCIDMYDPAINTAPPAFDTLGRLLNWPNIVRERKQPLFGAPVELKLRLDQTNQRQVLVTAIGPSDYREFATVERLDDHSVRLTVERRGVEPFTFAAEVPGDASADHVFRFTSSALYPLRSIEMPESISRERFRPLKTWVRVDWDGKRVIDRPVRATPWRTQQIVSATHDFAVPEAASFSGQVLEIRRLPIDDEKNSGNARGVRLRVTFDADDVGHSYPLAVTGHLGRGNFLFLRPNPNDSISFGYDHWGKPGLHSPPVALSPGVHVIEFWMPSILFKGEATIPSLVIHLDGKLAWTVAVPFYATTAEEVYLATNPLGGTACEQNLPHAAIETTDLPPPN